MNERDIFIQALQIEDATQQADFLNEACGTDEALRKRVQSLLQSHKQAESFLESTPAPDVTIDQPITEREGTVIGPYKLLEQIGEGGMGVVYMADQTEPMERRVALKIIKPGMDTREVIARFEAERQALAMMDHPNIAKVLDAGTTDSGRPYFVMELVKGVPITKYCDDKHLTARERLELFLPVCHAVQHAHQKGIIHRDLKPSNVLVALYDDNPVPKVIDFGVAKATSHKLTEKTMFTRYGQIVGTLEYMSPEQAQVNQLDIDTRSDIYSLGVLLYELLTGTTPFDKETLRTAAFDEMLRIIREDEPPKPSTRLSSSDTLPSIASNRNTEPHKLSALVRGDIDWIVMKALEKDRTRRYETANGFAADIGRFLNDEPVEACPPSATYKFRKFARRNKAAITTASVVVAALILGIIGTSWQAVRATKAEKLAHVRFEREQATLAKQANERLKINQQINDAVVEVQRLKKEAEIADLDNTESWAAVLQAAERSKTLIEHELASPKLVNRVTELLATLDKAEIDRQMVKRLDDIRLKQAATDTTTNNFTIRQAIPEYKAAFDGYGIAVETLSTKQAAERLRNCSPTLRRSLIAGMDHWCNLVIGFEKNSAESRERCDWLIDVISEIDSDPWRTQAREAIKKQDFNALHSLAETVDIHTQPPSTLVSVARFLFRNPKDHQAAIAFLKRARIRYPNDFWINQNLGEMYRKTKPPQYEQSIRYYTVTVSIRPNSAIPWTNLGNVLKENGEIDEAITVQRNAISLHPDLAMAHSNLGNALSQKGKPDEAIAAYRKAIELQPDLAMAHHNLGIPLYKVGKLDEAIAEFRKAIELDPMYAFAHHGLGVALKKKGNVDEAIAAYRKAIELDPDYFRPYQKLGEALGEKGKVDEAIVNYRIVIELQPDFVSAHNNLGVALDNNGKVDEAIAAYRKAIELQPDHVFAHNNLGVALKKKGLLDEAILEYRKALQLNPNYTSARDNLSRLYINGSWRFATSADLSHRDPEKAVDYAKKAIELKPDSPNNWSNLGVASYRVGDWQASVDALQKSHQMKKGGDFYHRFFLAMAYWQLGQKDKARQAYRTIVAWMDKSKKYQNNKNLKRFRAEAEQLMGLNTPVFAPKPAVQKSEVRSQWSGDKNRRVGSQENEK